MLAPLAHIAGLPLEEALAMLAPALSVGFGALVLTAGERARARIASLWRPFTQRRRSGSRAARGAAPRARRRA